MDNQSVELTKPQLARKLHDAGYRNAQLYAKAEVEQAVLSGEICFDYLASGVMLHCTDANESVDGVSRAEVDSHISFNFLLEGRVDYGLGERRYTFSAEQHPILFVNVVSGPQLFTRYLKSGQRVKKLNITIDKQWLLNRCSAEQDRLQGNQLFSNQPSVYQWQLTEQTLDVVNRLFISHHADDLAHKLDSEHLVYQLLSTHCSQLINLASAQVTAIAPSPARSAQQSRHYESEIESLLDERLSLQQIAKQLGTSVSTLQRYFKSHHQLTVIEYIRNQRLEKARRALLFEHSSIGEAAYLAGYNHVGNFVTAFRKYFNMTPAQLTKRYSEPK
ncbi:helix-turn-helix transcriptional regulator [Neiella sp. HB171785]|uniref:Helix-turn-helix transcriptional regulator n=1 Tax=Neiella litorisoli TaxID=2771431 RepID=A0A8J6QLW6_9GAMM|nr:AraC family transcriptional regulator [Neiella litorisoli]MBD1390732.1 helix-turn-helix transcriptional regulator [Neiella litorisoli]